MGGKIESDEEEVIGEESDTLQAYLFKPVETKDYEKYLVPTLNKPLSDNKYHSDMDTDDLIEDAKNFVKASDIQLVDMEVWNDIDEKRRKRRLSRKERDRRKGKGK